MWGVLPKGDRDAGQARGLPRLGAEHVRYTLLLRCHARRRRQAVARRALGLVGAGCRWPAGRSAGRHLAVRARRRQLQHRRQLDPATVPTGTAFFSTSGTTALSFSASASFGGWTFNPGASAYNFTNGIQNPPVHRRRHRRQRRQRHHHQQLHLPGISTTPARRATPPSPTTASCSSTTPARSAALPSPTTYFRCNSTTPARRATPPSPTTASCFSTHNSTAGSAALVNNAGGLVDFSDSTGPNGDGKLSADRFAGAGRYVSAPN